MGSREVVAELIEAKLEDKSKFDSAFHASGIKIGQLYTNMGFPIDMALERIHATKLQKLAVLDGACEWLIEHKRNSGATDKAIERQRRANRESLARFLTTGETGVY